MTARSLRILAATSLVAFALAACGSTAPAPTTAPDASVAASAPAAALPLEVDVATAAAMQADGAFLLDVRQPDEWAAGHIDGATLVPLGDLASRTAELPTDRRIVVVCRSGNRSAQGRDVLLAAGFPAVTSMAGGMNDWVAAGQPVVTGE